MDENVPPLHPFLYPPSLLSPAPFLPPPATTKGGEDEPEVESAPPAPHSLTQDGRRQDGDGGGRGAKQRRERTALLPLHFASAAAEAVVVTGRRPLKHGRRTDPPTEGERERVQVQLSPFPRLRRRRRRQPPPIAFLLASAKAEVGNWKQACLVRSFVLRGQRPPRPQPVLVQAALARNPAAEEEEADGGNLEAVEAATQDEERG